MPDVGDYILADVSPYTTRPSFIEFLATEPGKIKQRQHGKLTSGYFVTYENIPFNLNDEFGMNNVRYVADEDIIVFAKTKEELLIKLAQMKYNL